MRSPETTRNGFDVLWIVAINRCLEDRDVETRATDLTQDQWDKYLGPLIDEIERRDPEKRKRHAPKV